ncbi:MAG: alpha/beta fold hydrolase [Flavobacteriales bacterium]|nr:alpha/beta fold hydrolase [Flavobacteriales bacterium]
MLRSVLFFTIAITSVTLRAQYLISDSLLIAYTPTELAAQGIVGADYTIEAHRLIYHTIDPFGQPTIASGAVVIPVGSTCQHAMAAYHHGTILNRQDVPSRISSEMVVGYYLAADDYVAVLPDYLGLGDSPGPHPYIHAASEATASRDMLRAAREFCAQRNVQLNGQLFLIGYSQGGHACAATHRLLQEEHTDEFTVTASAPCSGPYDVSGVQAQVMVSPDPYPAPYYLPYVILSYRYVYPGLFGEVDEIIEEPWATLLPPLFQGNNGSGAVDAIMPAAPSEIIIDAVLQDFINDPDHPFRQALRDNDLYDWAPTCPTRIIYCEGDNHVFYQNSSVAIAAMQSNGAPSVQGQSAGAALDHSGCAFPALLNAKMFIDSHRTPCSSIGIAEVDAAHWNVGPNPVVDRFRIARDDAKCSAQWRLLTADGRVALNGMIAVAETEHWIDVSALTPSLYLLEMDEERGRAALRIAVER